jgi:hypothetical protein
VLCNVEGRLTCCTQPTFRSRRGCAALSFELYEY